MSDGDNQGPEERPRPRVVDKRVSARDASAPDASPPTPEPDPPSPANVGSDAGASAGSGEPPGWTPEQQEEARLLVEQMAKTPSIEWVANACVTLASLADTKLRIGDHADARLPIDALSGILDAAGGSLGDFEKPLRQTLGQLQMAFAQAVSGSQGG